MLINPDPGPNRLRVEDAPTILIRKLETRLDNIVFRMGFADSRSQARQFVSHGHFLVNGKKVDVPSYHLKEGDKIALRPASLKKGLFQNISSLLKKHDLPEWLSLDIKKLEGGIKRLPTLEEVIPPAEIPMIFEFYSR